MKGLPYEVKALLTKARDSAVLAVETYNRPSATFRSGAYIVLMVIAWTALFHAIFIRKGTKPFYRKPGSRRFQKVDGENKRWELSECLNQFFKDQNPPVRKNLEFFIKLRNRIEHCSLAQLDPEIFGECQAMLLNFEQALVSEFGERHAIRGGLTFALQFAKSVHKAQTADAAKSQQKTFRSVKQFIDAFRSSLSADVQSDMGYSFKVYLVPKIGNHASADAVAVEWVKYDPSRPEEMKQYERIVALIKPKEVQVANLGLLKPSEVVSRVATAIKRPFNQHHHTVCYRHFNARPPKGAADPKACDGRYCIYDARHNDYGYTDDWVQHPVKALSDQATYEFLFMKKVAGPQLKLANGGSAA